ncbi:MAG: hypothetical protein VST71_05675 [Nitrospirota bacterium]|nr:hypothetical protein [Nitrospirota bacterium]
MPDSNEKYLILLDTDKIHDYVFATNKLKEITGASALIDELVLHEIPSCTESFKFQVIFSNGGTSLIRAANTSDDEVERFINQIKNKFYELTETGTITCVWASYNAREFTEVRDELYRKLKDKKLSNDKIHDLISSPFLKFCTHCGIRKAEKDYESNTFICPSCLKKILEGEKEKKTKYNIRSVTKGRRSIYSYFFEKDGNAAFPKDLSEIGAASTPSNYIGFIYADGNQVGEKLKQIKSENEYRRFSDMLDRTTKESAVETAMECFGSSNKYPMEFILAGGDDLIMVVPGNMALPVAVKFCDKFQDKSRNDKDPNDITTSVGLVISHSTYPVKSLLRLSESLLKAAKEKGWKEKTGTQSDSMINFMIVKGSMLRPNAWKEDYIYKSYEGTKMNLTLKPYRTDEIKRLLSFIQSLKRAGMPGSKLKVIREILLKDKAQSVLEFCQLLSRLKGNGDVLDVIFSIDKDFNLDFMPWKKEGSEFYTPFLDIVELYDFISPEVKI